MSSNLVRQFLIYLANIYRSQAPENRVVKNVNAKGPLGKKPILLNMRILHPAAIIRNRVYRNISMAQNNGAILPRSCLSILPVIQRQ